MLASPRAPCISQGATGDRMGPRCGSLTRVQRQAAPSESRYFFPELPGCLRMRTVNFGVWWWLRWRRELLPLPWWTCSADLLPFLESKPCLHYITTEKGLAVPWLPMCASQEPPEAGGFWAGTSCGPHAWCGCGKAGTSGSLEPLHLPSRLPISPAGCRTHHTQAVALLTDYV